MQLTYPLLHMNGTSAEGLRRPLEDAYAALDAAYEALKQTAPNGRDYYTSPGTMHKAEEEHRSRLKRIDSIKAEIESLIGNIDDQEDAQKA